MHLMQSVLIAIFAIGFVCLMLRGFDAIERTFFDD